MLRSDQTVQDGPLIHVQCLEHYPVVQGAGARFNDNVGKTGLCGPCGVIIVL